MCFNISLNKSPSYIQSRFDALFDKDHGFSRIYHVAGYTFPSLPVLTNESPDNFIFMQWGLIPYWTKDEEQAEKMRKMTGNARAESIFEKSSFRVPARKKRCIVPVDGFFEWREVGGKKYPYYIQMKDEEAFAIAGLWDSWTNRKTGYETNTFTLITTEANPLLAEIHNTKKRMPAILERYEEKRWIQNEIDRDELEYMLKPYDEDKMKAHPVRKLILERDSNIPEALEEVTYDGLTEQQTLF